METKLRIPSINEFSLCGHLTADVELKEMSEGGKFLRGTVAVNESWKDKDGNWQQKANFIPFTFWRTEVAESLAERLKKGTPVLITGKLTSRTWDKEGEKQFANDQRAERIQVLSYQSNGDAE
jgi:single-strand DNA-binding protein